MCNQKTEKIGDPRAKNKFNLLKYWLPHFKTEMAPLQA